MNEIILDQIAIWTPKATNGCTRRVTPTGISYKEKNSNILSRSDKPIYRFAKNYYLGGKPVADAIEIQKKLEETNDNSSAKENSDEVLEEKSEVEETSKDTEKAESIDKASEKSPKPLKFCLFVRTFNDSTEIERKLDAIAKKISEQEVLAALGRAQSQGSMSFEYTKHNLGEIE